MLLPVQSRGHKPTPLRNVGSGCDNLFHDSNQQWQVDISRFRPRREAPPVQCTEGNEEYFADHSTPFVAGILVEYWCFSINGCEYSFGRSQLHLFMVMSLKGGP